MVEVRCDAAAECDTVGCDHRTAHEETETDCQRAHCLDVLKTVECLPLDKVPA